MGIDNLRRQFENQKIKFSGRSSLKKGAPITKTAQSSTSNDVHSKKKPTPEEVQIYDIVKTIIGPACAAFEVHYSKGGGIKPHIATVYYKEWAQGVGVDSSITDATINALRILRGSLIQRRDNLNSAIDKLQI